MKWIWGKECSVDTLGTDENPKNISPFFLQQNIGFPAGKHWDGWDDYDEDGLTWMSD